MNLPWVQQMGGCCTSPNKKTRVIWPKGFTTLVFCFNVNSAKMKRIKQEQHIEIEEKSQQLKFRMQTEIQIDKHHALCQASDQLEELDYTKLYFAYSGIRKSQIEPRVLFKVLVCAYIYAKETRTEVREGRCGFRL